MGINVKDIMAQVEKTIKRGAGIAVVSPSSVELDGSSVDSLYRELNVQWMINQFPPLTTYRSSFVSLILFTKRVIRKLIAWYTAGLVNQQQAFNATSVRLLNFLHFKIDSLEMERSQLKELVESLTNRIQKLQSTIDSIENRLRPAPPLTDKFDYLGFEDAFRGPREVVKRNFEDLVDHLPTDGVVYDLGCGRGEILETLVERGINCRGVDTSEQMVSECLKLGLDVVRMDALECLESLPDNSLSGVIMSHVIEHVTTDYLMKTLRMCYDKLRLGGCLILETPNPMTILVSTTTFYLDPTHRFPLHPQTLSWILKSIGFESVDVEYRHPFPLENRLSAKIAGETLLSMELDNLLYGPRDYAVIARRGRW